MKRAILLSGGIDSASIAYWKKPDIAININYGQKCAQAELSASTAIAKAIKIKLFALNVNCSSLGSGDLTETKALKLAPVSEWWPYRNQLLITIACMKAIALNVNELIIGAVKTDSKHKDGRLGFYDRINELVKYQEGKIKITCPAIHLTSDELIIKSKIPASILGWTHSCHISNYPCGQCNGCLKHLHTKEKVKVL